MTTHPARPARGSSVAPIRLGFNIDHIATLRNARGGRNPDPLRAAQLAVEAGADNITAHLREDRRHIRDDDIKRLAAAGLAPLNLEMAVTQEMLAIALATRPHACCLVPERRQEITTEGGLDVAGQTGTLAPFVTALRRGGIQVALFIDPDLEGGPARERELARLVTGAREAAKAGLEVHAGHGLDYDNVVPIASIPEIVELNIGHYLVGEALFVGLAKSISRMRTLVDGAREALRQQETEAKIGGTRR